jgi:hypothetical protein
LKRVLEASYRSELSKRVIEASSPSEFSKRVLEASSQSDFGHLQFKVLKEVFFSQVRVRNHAKMVDVYLSTFNNQKSMFGNKKATAENVVNNPEKFHIYDGISTMTNISRYDLPHPDAYKVFFGLHSMTEFPTLQSTCTYFKVGWHQSIN